MVKLSQEPPIEREPEFRPSIFEPMRPGATMLPIFERRMIDANLLRIDLELHLARHPDLVDEAIAEVDRAFYLSRGAGRILDADSIYKTFKADLLVARSMTDKPSRDAMIFRASYWARRHLHEDLHPYGAKFEKIGDYLRTIAGRLDEQEAEKYLAAYDAGLDLAETEMPPAEPTTTTKPGRKPRASKKEL